MVWHNGELRETAWVDASSAGLTLGWGVFSTLAVREGRATLVAQHVARLRRDAARCAVEVPFSNAQLSEGLGAVIAANGVRNGLARLTATRRGDGRWNTDAAGSEVTILALEAAPSKVRGLRVTVAPAPELGALRGVKTTSYLPFLWEWQRALAAGYDEVILLDAQEQVVEAARSSLFWVRGGRLETSPLASGALEGIGRDIVLRGGREAQLHRSELVACEELLLVSAATGPRSIAAVEGTELPREAPVFERLRAWWDEQI